MFTGGSTVAADATATVVVAMFRVLDFGSVFFLFHCSSIYRREKFMYLYHRLVFLSVIYLFKKE